MRYDTGSVGRKYFNGFVLGVQQHEKIFQKLEIRSVERGICPIPESIRLCRTLPFFNARVRSCLISTSGLKSVVTIIFFYPDFLHGAEIPAIREHYRHKLAI